MPSRQIGKMMSKDKALVVKATQLAAAPDFMKEDEGAGAEALAQFLRPPFLKVVKDQSKALKKEGFEVGAVLINPDGAGNRVVMDPKGSFKFTPLFFYVEYCAR